MMDKGMQQNIEKTTLVRPCNLWPGQKMKRIKRAKRQGFTCTVSKGPKDQPLVFYTLVLGELQNYQSAACPLLMFDGEAQ